MRTHRILARLAGPPTAMMRYASADYARFKQEHSDPHLLRQAQHYRARAKQYAARGGFPGRIKAGRLLRKASHLEKRNQWQVNRDYLRQNALEYNAALWNEFKGDDRFAKIKYDHLNHAAMRDFRQTGGTRKELDLLRGSTPGVDMRAVIQNHFAKQRV